jgi:hypothetical protein
MNIIMLNVLMSPLQNISRINDSKLKSQHPSDTVESRGCQRKQCLLKYCRGLAVVVAAPASAQVAVPNSSGGPGSIPGRDMSVLGPVD